LKDAQDYKVQTRKGVTTAWAGANVDILRKYEQRLNTGAPGTKKFAKLKALSRRNKLHRPTNIDWLVNYGHVVGPTDTFVLQGLMQAGRFIPGSHYIERAWAQFGGVVHKRVTDKLTENTFRELYRHTSKMRP
jgi:hypothetical protein